LEGPSILRGLEPRAIGIALRCQVHQAVSDKSLEIVAEVERKRAVLVEYVLIS
jgi:hypothetical protein